MDKLIWHTEQCKVKDLIPFEGNPRKMTEKQAEDLRKSLERLNLIDIPAKDTDGTIVGGHKRMVIMQLLGRGEEIIDVRVPNRKLTDSEFIEANLRLNKNTGEFDFDMLANFDEEILKDIGWNQKELDFIFQIDLDIDKDDDLSNKKNESMRMRDKKILILYLHDIPIILNNTNTEGKIKELREIIDIYNEMDEAFNTEIEKILRNHIIKAIYEILSLSEQKREKSQALQ